jgi:hypothetical protein
MTWADFVVRGTLVLAVGFAAAQSASLYATGCRPDRDQPAGSADADGRRRRCSIGARPLLHRGAAHPRAPTTRSDPRADRALRSVNVMPR